MRRQDRAECKYKYKKKQTKTKLIIVKTNYKKKY